MPFILMQVEDFAAALFWVDEGWSLPVLNRWQRSLRRRTYNLHFKRRLWYHLVHRINLRAGPVVLQIALWEFLKRDLRRGCRA
jgi:hypothetical protein